MQHANQAPAKSDAARGPGRTLGRTRPRSASALTLAASDELTRVVYEIPTALRPSSEMPTLAIERLESAIERIPELPATDLQEDEATTAALPVPAPPTSEARQRTMMLPQLPVAPLDAGAPRFSVAAPVTRRTRRRRSAWPLVVWGLLAGAFAGLAVIASPLGDPRMVKREIAFASHVAGAIAAGAHAAAAELSGASSR